ncbi:MAG: hypothetical protein ACI8R4_003467, partial [Paracoccaceae bacterium]
PLFANPNAQQPRLRTVVRNLHQQSSHAAHIVNTAP